jgi:hypothetical protein
MAFALTDAEFHMSTDNLTSQSPEDLKKAVRDIIQEARAKLQKLGVRTAVSSRALPGAKVSSALLFAASEFDLQAELLSLQEGRDLAYMQGNAFSLRVNFAVEEAERAGSAPNADGEKFAVPSPVSKPINHGSKWNAEADQELMVLWSYNGMQGTIDYIATKMSRSTASISHRLVLTGLVDSREEAREISRRRQAKARAEGGAPS